MVHTLLELTIASITINHQMAMLQLQVGKNFIKDVFLNGGSKVNIITEKLKGQSKPKLTPYNLCIADQTIIETLGII